MASKRHSTDTAVPALSAPNDMKESDRSEIAQALNAITADMFALYLKTKNFHWHMSGPHFRDYHLLLDEQGDQIIATIDPLAERSRKLGMTTLRSIGHIARLQSVKDDDRDFVTPKEMLSALIQDNTACAAAMRRAHEMCEDAQDAGSASLLEVYIDETERRTWFLFEAGRGADGTGH
jgi:starvation-inducible DNA-binding protein